MKTLQAVLSSVVKNPAAQFSFTRLRLKVKWKFHVVFFFCIERQSFTFSISRKT